ncbi:MAG: hypothetical protein A3A94_03470 [Candidatus Portnoybacteria bacterium RIFCSPLOWO2_01_FULL_43_11]|uniref:Carbamoyltransferase n=3 Tax=Bacteria candidate phyla TaxID=1783234 RepID=A0A1G2FRX2_9BACT|nr:MAG: hypothetical protein A2713_01805 [candidate division WWE3 bacterium RIFCSPHIGHO2_01_FULL_35_17]OGZ38409.1 MAG: hypothetical protein A3A94_03470 [Candidatus Portnoybacteria bacterium RIFCSPLOWO2_01_FULL_43_11]OGZ40836.1 MAG: hypothetical protein A3I20_02425 [Candidatus Portnoybacteria bacterium RIFCSPLOWO2_02_FULL_40_15]
MNILGLSFFYHDSAACLLKDGEITAAVEEERFSRQKHDSRFPKEAVKYCLKTAGLNIQDVDYIGFYEKPFLKFERILEGYVDTFPRSYRAFVSAMKIWLKEKIWIKDLIKKELNYRGKIYFIEHHLSHAAGSFLISPFKEAAILTVDAVGERAAATCGVGRNNKIEILKEINWPDSLGMLYSAFTYYLGFKVNSAEYKVMGAAPYGRPIYADLIKEELIDIKEDGSFKMNMDYFEYHYGLKMVNKKFENIFGGPRREPERKIEQRHWDIAASIQAITNEIMVKMANHLYEETKLKNICLAGGVALNCVSNSKILKETPFEKMFIQPAAGDAGGAMGAALYIDNVILDNGRRTKWSHAYLGPEFSNEEIGGYLEKLGVKYQKLEEEKMIKIIARLIAEQKIIGWFQGRMEWGPRALGNRSIIADARNKENWQKVNLKIKFRESFRPFAPTVLEEKTEEYFDLPKKILGEGTPTPYMLLTAQVKKQIIPAVTHLDNSARLQTISIKENYLYYNLIKEFENLTNCPVVINTSFNVRGEPIVCTPKDAFLCFMKTDIDYLAMGNYLLDKKEMPTKEIFLKEKEFSLD